jgi:hypothetical protein
VKQPKSQSAPPVGADNSTDRAREAPGLGTRIASRFRGLELEEDELPLFPKDALKPADL